MIESKLINSFIDASAATATLFQIIGQCDVFDQHGTKLHSKADPGLIVANLEDCAVIPLAEYKRLKALEASRASRNFKILNTHKP
jgi:hypothetical protein